MFQVLRPSQKSLFANGSLGERLRDRPKNQPLHTIQRRFISGLMGFAFSTTAMPSAIAYGAENVSVASNHSGHHSQHHAPNYAPMLASVDPSTVLDPLMAQAMYHELENLTGRVESTYLFSKAQNQPTQLRTVDPTLTASGSVASTVPTPLPAELQAAQALLADWRGLINQGEYETVRDRWQTVTQALQNTSQIANRFISQAEVRSIWLDRETIVSAGSEQGLTKVFEKFKAAGINTVFVETVNAGYPIYPSTVAPAQNPLIRGWDPLESAVELGKAYNIEVHAWVWLFAAGNQAHNRLVGQPASYPGPVLSAHPDWAGYDNHGNLIIPGQTKTFLDPANPEVRQYLFNLLSEIAGRYDVDGIQFDYVRYPFQDPSANRLFGYGTAAREQFQTLTGVDPIILSPKNGGDSRSAYYWNQWTYFRTQNITSFVGVLKLARRNPSRSSARLQHRA